MRLLVVFSCSILALACQYEREVGRDWPTDGGLWSWPPDLGCLPPCGCPCGWGEVPTSWVGVWSGELADSWGSPGGAVDGRIALGLRTMCDHYLVRFDGTFEASGAPIDAVDTLLDLGCDGTLSGDTLSDELRDVSVYGRFEPGVGFEGTWSTSGGGSGAFRASSLE